MTTSPLDRLTVTRFFAALFVVCQHLGADVPLVAQSPLSSVLMAGSVAVTYFFVLSGFVMSMVYGDLEPGESHDFWRARFARIYPVYLLGLVCSVGRDPDPFGWLLSLVLVQAWVPGYALSANAVGWSLSVELFFYAVFPALIGLARRFDPVRWCAGVAMVWLASQAWAAYAHHTITGNDLSVTGQIRNYFPLAYLPCFLLGMTAGLLVRRYRLSFTPRVLSLLVVGSCGLTIAVLMSNVPTSIPKYLGLLAPVFAVNVVALYHLPSRWRESATAKLLGESSYALYILHWPLAPIIQGNLVSVLDLAPSSSFVVTVVILVGISVFVFLKIETPARMQLRQRRVVLTPQ